MKMHNNNRPAKNQEGRGACQHYAAAGVAALALLSGCSDIDEAADGIQGPEGQSTASLIDDLEQPSIQGRLLPAGAGVASGDGFGSLHRGGGLAQSVSYGEWWSESNPAVVVLREVYSTGVPSSPDEYLYEFGTAYDVLGYAPRDKDKFYVLGLSSNGETIIEQWLIGGGLIGGGGPGGPKLAARSEKYRGTALTSVRDIGAEPENRSIYLLEGSPVALTSFDVATGALTSLYTSAQIPGLEECYYLYGMQHETEGRIWIAEDAAMSTIVMFKDADNDGVFESYTVHDYSSWVAGGYDDDVWTDNFIDE